MINNKSALLHTENSFIYDVGGHVSDSAAYNYNLSAQYLNGLISVTCVRVYIMWSV